MADKALPKSDQGGDVVVIPGEGGTYLWVGGRDNRCVAIISGKNLARLRDDLNALAPADA